MNHTPVRLPIGLSNFKKLIESDYYFVDKSLFIKSFMEDNAEVLVFPRPRRFGKTLTLSMMYYFLEGFLENNTEDLFKDLAISQDKAFCKAHQGQYPVILISFKDIKEDNFEDAEESIKTLLSDLYQDYEQDLLSSLSDRDKAIYLSILNQTASYNRVKYALVYLSQWLFEKTGKKAIILIDEYDSPITAAYTYHYYDKMIGLMRGILSSTLKDNHALEKAVVTGINRISKESIFSGANNFLVFSSFHPRYGDTFGFVEEEVKALLKVTGYPHLFAEIKAWYNGYYYDKHTVYNPWSILNCLDSHGALSEYWVNTSSNDLIKSLMAEAKVSMKAAIVKLLQGEVIEQPVDESLVFTELDRSESAVWGLLLNAGYVTVEGYRSLHGVKQCCLKIPNQEVASIYQKIVQFWFSTGKEINVDSYLGFIQNLVNGEVEAFNHSLNEYLSESGSYFDFSKHSQEKVFHTFVLGLVVGLREAYWIESNRESGKGRLDVVLKPKDANKQGIILEFKTTPEANDLGKAAEAALSQIKSKAYVKTLKQQGVRSALLLGIAFCGQEALIASEAVGLS